MPTAICLEKSNESTFNNIILNLLYPRREGSIQDRIDLRV